MLFGKVNTQLTPSCQIRTHETRLLSLSSGAATAELLKEQSANSSAHKLMQIKPQVLSAFKQQYEGKRNRKLQLEPNARPSPAGLFVTYTRLKVSWGCLLMRKNVYESLTGSSYYFWGGFSQSYQTSIKVLVK